jgi:hypothetical protein
MTQDEVAEALRDLNIEKIFHFLFDDKSKESWKESYKYR